METFSVALVCSIISATVAYLNFQRLKSKDAREERAGLTKVEGEIKYISKGVDDIKYDTRNLSQTITNMNERIIRVEESSKSAHKRLDEVDSLLKNERLERRK